MKKFFLSTYVFVLLAVVVTSVVTAWLTNVYANRAYRDAIKLANQDISRGCFYLLEKEITSSPEQSYKNVIEELKPKFGYPIALLEKEELALSEPEQRDVRESGIIVRDEGELLISQIGDSSYFVSMGPFPDIQFKPLEISILYVAGAVLLGTLLLPWAIFFWRKLVRVNKAAEQFGKGDFSARVEISKYSSLFAIAKAFNSMADQIERLISSHKHLVNAVSHELRTPISRIRFGIEEFREAAGEEQMKHLAGIRNDVDELDDLVSELLSYIRYERAAAGINLQEKPLLPWLQEYFSFVGESLDSEKAISFSSAGVDETLTVKFNPRLFERALHNILQNSIRFASSSIVVKLFPGEDGIVLCVADDGPGIEEKDRLSIFEPFVRLESSRNRESGGYGLGLSIVREIMRNHGGAVSVDESDMGGAEFRLVLPVPCLPRPRPHMK